MRIEVIVTPKAKQNVVIKVASNQYKVKTTAPAERGKANEAVIELLADYFKVKKSEVELISGDTFRKKLFEID